MGGGISLPREFTNVLNALGVQEVKEAYGDEEYSGKNGIGDLRDLLGLKDTDRCCDIYCSVSLMNGSEEKLLLEDKGRPNKKGKHIVDAMNQIEDVASKIKLKGLDCDKYILCNCKIPREKKRVFGTQTYSEHHPNLKVIHFKMPRKKPKFIEPNKPLYSI